MTFGECIPFIQSISSDKQGVCFSFIKEKTRLREICCFIKMSLRGMKKDNWGYSLQFLFSRLRMEGIHGL